MKSFKLRFATTEAWLMEMYLSNFVELFAMSNIGLYVETYYNWFHRIYCLRLHRGLHDLGGTKWGTFFSLNLNK